MLSRFRVFPRLKPGVFIFLTPDFSLGNRRISCVSIFGNPERFAKEQTSNVQRLILHSSLFTLHSYLTQYHIIPGLAAYPPKVPIHGEGE
jgi:hypothetical protein